MVFKSSCTPMKGKLRPQIYSPLRIYPKGGHVIDYVVSATTMIIVPILHERIDPERHIDIK